jgi:WD domain, G-beta repeat/Planctomycete cytochrome C
MRAFRAITLFWLLGSGGLALGPRAAASDPTYWEEVRPILRRNCTVCHSVRNLDEPDVSGGVALDSYEAIRQGPGRPLIRPGNGERSLIIRMVTLKDKDRRMPLGAAPLAAEEIALLRRWIDAGAPEGKHVEADTRLAVAHAPRRLRHVPVHLVADAPPGDQPRPRGRMEVTLPIGPLAPVTAVTFSPDGRWLAAGRYRQVVIWNLEQNKPVRVLTDFLGTVDDLRFSPDGRLLAAGGGQPSARGDLRLFRTSDWKLLAVLRDHQDVVFSVAFDPTGKRLASASFDKTVRIWNLANFKPEQELTGHSDIVYSVAFSPDGKWLVSASKDRSLRVIDAATWKSRLTLSGMDQDVLAVAVSPDGKQIVSAGYEPALHWWNPQTGQPTALRGGHGNAVNEICFSKDGRWVASASSDQTVRLWNGKTGALERSLQLNSIVYAVAIRPDSKLLACGTFDGRVLLWDPATGKQASTYLAVAHDPEHFDWLVLTPGGQLTGSPEYLAEVRWQPAGKKR